MKKICIIALTLLLSIAQGVWATSYSYYIVERDGQTLYFKGTNTEPNAANHQYSITETSGGVPYWVQDLEVWKSITKIVFEPSFAEARPTDTRYWFTRKPNLTTIEGMQEFLNTSEVTNMNDMFMGCSSLTELDLSGFNTAKVTEMWRMFEGCTNLTTIAVGTGWTTSKVSTSNSYNMFNGCTSIIGQDGTTYDANALDKSKAHYGTGGYLTTEGKYWNGRAATGFADVSGSTVTIHNIGEMALLAQNVNGGNTYSGYTFLLAKDLVYDISTTNNYTTIGNASLKYFAGTFDGQGYTISGINISAEGRQGLFGTVSGATIKNVKLSASTIKCTSGSAVGGIASYADNDGVTIENCHVSGSVTIESGNNGGGIIGTTNAGNVNITGCTSGAITSTRNSISCIGGIVGSCGNSTGSLTTITKIENCLYYGTSLTGCEKKGGIVGYYYTTYGSIANQSSVSLSQNFYTYPDASAKGIGSWRKTNTSYSDDTNNFDITDDFGAVRVHTVTADADIADMGTAGTPVENGITLYTYGIKYGNAYYSHVLALPNNADNTALINQYAGQTFNVKLRGRTLYKDGCWNTLCLPFNMDYFTGSIFAGGTERSVCEMDNSDTKTGVDGKKLYIYIKDASSIKAGKPYLVKWERASDYNPNDPATYDHANPMFNNVTIDNSTPAAVTSYDRTVSFTPIYIPFSRDYEDRSVLLVGAGNNLYYPDGGGEVSLKPFRAYFQLNGVQMSSGDDDDDNPGGGGGGAVKAFVLNIEDDATSLNEELRMKNEEIATAKEWYSLDGKRLTGKPSAKGIYVNNGRKVVFK